MQSIISLLYFTYFVRMSTLRDEMRIEPDTDLQQRMFDIYMLRVNSYRDLCPILAPAMPPKTPEKSAKAFPKQMVLAASQRLLIMYDGLPIPDFCMVPVNIPGCSEGLLHHYLLQAKAIMQEQYAPQRRHVPADDYLLNVLRAAQPQPGTGSTGYGPGLSLAVDNTQD